MKGGASRKNFIMTEEFIYNFMYDLLFRFNNSYYSRSKVINLLRFKYKILSLKTNLWITYLLGSLIC